MVLVKSWPRCWKRPSRGRCGGLGALGPGALNRPRWPLHDLHLREFRLCFLLAWVLGLAGLREHHQSKHPQNRYVVNRGNLLSAIILPDKPTGFSLNVGPTLK